MPRSYSKAVVFASILSAAALSSGLFAQYEKGKPSPSPSPGTMPGGHSGHQMGASPSPAMSPAPKTTRPMEPAAKATMPGASLTATLVDQEAKAQKQAAAVKVTVRGVRIVDPALSKEKPIKGQGHLHYQVDDGPIIATTTMKLSFHGLKPGTHNILVALAANDHSPLGPEQKLSVSIP